MTDLTTPPTPVGTLIRLTVAAGDRRVDLGAPGNVPVAEIVPGLARTLGLLDSSTVYGGYHLLRADSEPVDSGRSLLAQGIEDGAILTLDLGAHRRPTRVYDDVVEAVADAVEDHYAPWTARDSAMSAAWAAVALLTAGALLLLGGDQASALPPVVAGVSSLLVLICGAIVGRVGAEPAAGRVLVLSSTVLAAAAGLTATGGAPSWGWPTAFAGLGALVVGVLAIPALAGRRELSSGPILVGLALTTSGMTIELTGASSGTVLSLVIAIVATASIGIPWLALSSTPLRVVSARDDAEILLVPPPVEPEEIRAQHERGHRLQVSLRAAVGMLTLVTIPPVIQTGAVGALLLVLCYVGMLLSTRQTFSRLDVLLVVGVGIVGLAGTGVTAALMHPTLRGPLVMAIGVAAAGVIGIGLVAPRQRVGLARVADMLELACLALLLPLGVTAAGLV